MQRLLILSIVCLFTACNNPKINKTEIRAKLSHAGNLCHGVNSPWFKRLKHFTPYKSMQECLKHGRRRAY